MTISRPSCKNLNLTDEGQYQFQMRPYSGTLVSLESSTPLLEFSKLVLKDNSNFHIVVHTLREDESSLKIKIRSLIAGTNTKIYIHTMEEWTERERKGVRGTDGIQGGYGQLGSPGGNGGEGARGKGFIIEIEAGITSIPLSPEAISIVTTGCSGGEGGDGGTGGIGGASRRKRGKIGSKNYDGGNGGPGGNAGSGGHAGHTKLDFDWYSTVYDPDEIEGYGVKVGINEVIDGNLGLQVRGGLGGNGGRIGQGGRGHPGKDGMKDGQNGPPGLPSLRGRDDQPRYDLRNNKKPLKGRVQGKLIEEIESLIKGIEKLDSGLTFYREIILNLKGLDRELFKSDAKTFLENLEKNLESLKDFSTDKTLATLLSFEKANVQEMAMDLSSYDVFKQKIESIGSSMEKLIETLICQRIDSYQRAVEKVAQLDNLKMRSHFEEKLKGMVK